MINEIKFNYVGNFLKVFGDESRIKILYVLDEKELSAGEISKILEMSQSAVSHQLKILKDNRIVKYRREGKNIFYSLDDDHVSIILKTAIAHIEEENL